MKELDKVELDRDRCVAIVEEKHRKKPKEVPAQKVWVKEELDISDIKVQPKITKKNEPKPKQQNENTLF